MSIFCLLSNLRSLRKYLYSLCVLASLREICFCIPRNPGFPWFNLEGLPEDAQGVVTGLEATVGHLGDNAFGVEVNRLLIAPKLDTGHGAWILLMLSAEFLGTGVR